MRRCILAILSLAFCTNAQAVSEDVQFSPVTPQGAEQPVGNVKVTGANRSLKFAPELRALPPGKYDFRTHAEGSCQSAMKKSKTMAVRATGRHRDPQHTGKREGPLSTGHLDDLPLPMVNGVGVVDQLTIIPRLKTLDEMKGKALTARVGGDNMADNLQPLGSGGERFACGVIKQSFCRSC